MKQNSKSIFRVEKNKDNPYIIMNKTILNDNQISWKAKGILAYLLSLPDDWQIYESEVASHSSDGLDSLSSGIKELIEQGYINRERKRNDNGQLKGYEYVVYEVSTKSGLSKVGLSKVGLSKIGKPQATNNNLTNNNLTNNNLTKANLSDSNAVNDFFERIWILYPNKKGKSTISKTTKNKLFKVGEDKLKLAIEHYQKELSLETWKHPMNGSTFFNGRYTDYLQENIPEPKKVDLSLKKNDMSKWE